jgi:HAD superfamily hydrolase (TIGR01484 family)
MIRLIATDIDGTLLNHRGELPQENAAALSAARELGIRLALVTVRKRDSTHYIAQLLNIPCAMICQGGATVYDEDGAQLGETPIAIEVAREIASYADMHGMALITTVGERNYYAPGIALSIHQQVAGASVASNVAALVAAPTRIMVYGAREVLQLSSRFAGGGVRIVRHYRAGELIDAVFTAPEAAKDAALAILCRRWQIGLADVLALGDSESDMEMLRAAGVGVAMGDAHPPVLVAADWVAPPADEAGLAAAVRRFVLNVKC